MNVKYRLVEADKAGKIIYKFPSIIKPAGLLTVGMKILHTNGNLYKITSMAYDMEMGRVSEVPEIHVVMIFVE